MATSVRLYVGGLPLHVEEKDLAARFQPFGNVLSIELLPLKKGRLPNVSPQELLQASRQLPAEGCFRGIAYVDLEPKDTAALQKCIKLYNHSKWRGSELRVELAQPSYLQRLKEEWHTDAEKEQQELEGELEHRVHRSQVASLAGGLVWT